MQQKQVRRVETKITLKINVMYYNFSPPKIEIISFISCSKLFVLGLDMKLI